MVSQQRIGGRRTARSSELKACGDGCPTREKDRRMMKLVSVNTGLPREVKWHGTMVTTGIFKESVGGRVALRKLNLDGDRQADLTVHGGEHKAVYCYSLAHYDYWKKELPGRELPMGMFGENFTIDGIAAVGATSGLAEDAVHLGDQFSIGSAEVVVTQPRLPCYKLGVRFGSDDMVRRFMVSGRTGLYVAKRYGDADVASVRRALRVAALPESWKAYFRERLKKAGTPKS